MQIVKYLFFFYLKAYYEICNKATNVVYDQNLKVPHGTVSGETVFYDNKQSVAEKVQKLSKNKHKFSHI